MMMMMMPNRTVTGLVALVLALGTLAGCGYSLAGRGAFLPDYIRTIAVPQFTNATPVYDVERRVTERVQAELIGRGRYTVEPVQRAGADAVLIGSISSITIVPVAFTQQQIASRYVLTLTAQVEFKDLKTDKVIWANPAVQFREEFEPTTGAAVADATDYFGQDANALDRIATEFARSVVSALLEAF
jgi:outer membrane lipopolysaccharide assembly protein LptE/RlpB